MASLPLVQRECLFASSAERTHPALRQVAEVHAWGDSALFVTYCRVVNPPAHIAYVLFHSLFSFYNAEDADMVDRTAVDHEISTGKVFRTVGFIADARSDITAFTVMGLSSAQPIRCLSQPSMSSPPVSILSIASKCTDTSACPVLWRRKLKQSEIQCSPERGWQARRYDRRLDYRKAERTYQDAGSASEV